MPPLCFWGGMLLSGPGRHERRISVTRTHGESVRIACNSFSFHCWYGLAFQGLSPAQSRVPPHKHGYEQAKWFGESLRNEKRVRLRVHLALHKVEPGPEGPGVRMSLQDKTSEI